MAINGSTNGQIYSKGSSNGKHPARASLSEISRGYNLSGADDDEVFDETESKRTGHTRNDQKDMSRMGKRQELIVSFFPIFFSEKGDKICFLFYFIFWNTAIRSLTFSLSNKTEEFSPTLSAELRRCTPGNVGVSFDVITPLPDPPPSLGISLKSKEEL